MQTQPVETHLPMVRQLARRLASRLPAHVELDDLVSAGALGLVEAADRFDADRGVSFADFARRRVEGAMLDTLRASTPTTRASRRLHREIESTRTQLGHRLGRLPEDEEIAAALGVDTRTLADKCAASAPLKVVGFEDLGVQDSARALVAAALQSEDARPDEVLALDEAKARIAEAVEALPERQRLVLSLYYVEELRLREIGELLGVTESRVCQIHGAAVRALRTAFRED